MSDNKTPETLEEIIERERKAFTKVNTEYGTRLHAALDALEDLALRFKTEMINRGAEESYAENEFEVMKILSPDIDGAPRKDKP